MPPNEDDETIFDKGANNEFNEDQLEDFLCDPPTIYEEMDKDQKNTTLALLDN